MGSLAEKLTHLGGAGRLKEREWRIRCRLNWHRKSRSAVRHLLYGERRPSLDEAREIEAAHLRLCAEQIEVNRADTARLFDAIRESLDAMERSDPEFYHPHIEAVRDLLLSRRDMGGREG